jgi:hypothetical protein
VKARQPQGHDKSADPNSRFFYVGSPPEVVSPLTSPVKPTPEAGLTRDDKFFHANEARPQLRQRVLGAQDAQTRSTPPSAIGGRSPQLSARQVRTTTRSVSPAKAARTRPISYGKDAPPAGKQSLSGSPHTERRRDSVGSGVSAVKSSIATHRKSMSANSVTSTPTRKLSNPRPPMLIPTLEERLGQTLNPSTTSNDSLPIPMASPEVLSARSVSIGSVPEDTPLSEPLITRPASINLSPISPTLETPRSPTASAPGDPAAQARRERKVLDLEISNSSLLAINKTLERELRKQNVELRRFRRLSRSGRLSFAPPGIRNVSNSTLGTLPEFDDDHEDNSGSNSASSDSEFADSGDEDELDVLSQGSGSAVGGTASTRARQRARDEKRLMLDLAKHQQMLLDSQKLSLSIRRCLTCSEELIRDGTKALEYRVGIGDVKVGGRVLRTDEEGEVGDSEDADVADAGVARKGLLSPGVELGDWLEGGLWVSSAGRRTPDIHRAGVEDDAHDLKEVDLNTMLGGDASAQHTLGIADLDTVSPL